MSAVLRVVAARFVRAGSDLMAPFSLELGAGERATLGQPDAAAAAVAARVAAAVVKPTFGVVHVGDFDSRLQPAQAKRLVGFVAERGFAGTPHQFERELGFRADVWGVEGRTMVRAAAAILATLGDTLDGAYARAVALALAPGVRLVVLERPPPGAFERIAAMQGGYATLQTCVAGDRALLVPSALEGLVD
jgi:hypothetical protein